MADLKKLKGIFWRNSEPQPQDFSPEPAVTFEPLSSPPISRETPADVAPEFFSAIEKELGKSMPIEFAEYYNQMSVINEKFSHLDEATRYQLAFHAARTALKTRKHDLTPASLIKSISDMVEVLDREKQEFKAQNEQSYQSNLAGVQKKAHEMSRGIKDRENRMQTLQKEMDAFLAAKSAEKKKLEDERAQLISQRVIAEGEMNQLGQKKTEREAKFSTALEAHLRRMDVLKSELEEHLKSIK